MADKTGTWRVGPLLFWRGLISPAKPWPRLLYADRVGWVLCVEGLIFGVRVRPQKERSDV